MVYFDPAEGMRPPPFVHSVFTALVVPRPIGWISTIGAGGVVNLAPFSYFNAVTGDPPCVMCETYAPKGVPITLPDHSSCRAIKAVVQSAFSPSGA